MSNLQLTVHEFLTIMGTLDEHLEEAGFEGESAIYDSWYHQIAFSIFIIYLFICKLNILMIYLSKMIKLGLVN